MSYKHLTLIERTAIFYRSSKGDSIRSIAKYLDRSHSTISRELKRNKSIFGHYVNEYAQKYAEIRKVKPRHQHKWQNQPLKDYLGSNSKCNFLLLNNTRFKHRLRCLVIQAFSWSIIQQGDSLVDLLLR